MTPPPDPVSIAVAVGLLLTTFGIMLGAVSLALSRAPIALCE